MAVRTDERQLCESTAQGLAMRSWVRQTHAWLALRVTMHSTALAAAALAAAALAACLAPKQQSHGCCRAWLQVHTLAPLISSDLGRPTQHQEPDALVACAGEKGLGVGSCGGTGGGGSSSSSTGGRRTGVSVQQAAATGAHHDAGQLLMV